ncbi:6-phospho-beta-glucosidase [Paenibacillus antibioticophila]|uniref:Amygdalase n=1 Tax=Paenibacillus antibioticophila TaxID=1274374 RepID=A0A919XNC8_9BACL|nr:glycoside hydrolase family 1 protein [Paenibacillus antibioticophila]GIO35944.1 6-phospho-beta-glucosidase [Paenibacillus antibioticophila]
MKIKGQGQFPPDFLFGASTSAYQYEGAYDLDGRGPSVMDLLQRKGGLADYKVGADHYHRYEEDIRLMAEIGLKAYRFSISWTRILPEGNGRVNPEGLQFYDKIINLLRQYNIEPIVTLYHFDYPQGLIDQYGGWRSRKSVDDFLEYATILFRHFGDRIKYWLTINEQDHVIHLPERIGLPGTIDAAEFDRISQQCSYHMCVATARIIERCHELVPGGQVGVAMNPMIGLPASSKPEDVLAAAEYNEIAGYYLLDLQCKGIFSPIYTKYLKDRGAFPEIDAEDLNKMRLHPPDFIGVNYYMNQTVRQSTSDTIAPRGTGVIKREEEGIYELVNNPHVQASEWGWGICPIGLKLVIMELYNRYGLPALITENGLGARDELLPDDRIEDDYRIAYLAGHLKELRDCVQMGYPVLGYCLWSFMDVVSGHDGMNKRYGLVYLNRKDQELLDLRRIRKDSFHWYGHVIATNGADL